MAVPVRGDVRVPVAEGAKPLMTSLNTFYLGFIETAVENNRDHNRVEKHINGLLEMHD